MSNTCSSLGGVIVAVDGTEQGYAAVRYAASEARRLDVRLDIVHVLPGYLAVAPMRMPVVPDASFASYGAEILARAKDAALVAFPGLEVGTHLREGDRSQRLLAFAEHARLIVLGSRSPRSLDRLWTGDTVTGVAGRAGCPLVVVPADRDPGEVHGRIAIGLKAPGQAGALFDAGFQFAHELETELVVLHAWRLQGVYDDIIAHQTETERWQREQTDLIEKELAHYRGMFPDVPVRVYVRHEDSAHALVRATRGDDRLLILRTSRGGLAHHLGRTARAVLRDAHCPVEVVPAPKGAGPTMARVLERPAELVP
jgi:nucleotide-binding universal stress UspA family protein